MSEANEFASLSHLKALFLNLTVEIIKADAGKLFPGDLLVIAVADRSVALMEAYANLTRDGNHIAAVSLVRLHLDTLLRFYSVWIVEDPHKHATDILAGCRLDKLMDRDGAKLTDRHLLNTFSEAEQINWVKNVYTRCNGYVHLSSHHILAPFKLLPEDRQFEIAIGSTKLADPEVIKENTAGMVAISREIARLLQGWLATKQRGITPTPPRPSGHSPAAG
jgi:hypothetical protein